MTITLVCILFVISLCQTTLLPHLAVYGVTPDAYLIFTVFFSLNADIKHASFVNWVNGLSKDLFSLAPFGVSAFLFVLIGYFIGRSKGFVFKEHPLTQVIITFLAAISYGFGCLIFILISSGKVALVIAAQKVVCSALYSAIISLLLYLVFKRFQAKLGLGESITFEKKS